MQKKQAISYVRFSSARQRGGSSVERQEEMIAAWMAKHSDDYELSSFSAKDLARSGYKGEHIKEGGEFAKILLAVEKGFIKKGDVILVEAIDRTGRLPLMRMLNQIIAPILESGVSIITLDDNTVYTEESVGGAHVFLLVAKIQAAHDYSKTLSGRVADSYTLRRKAAKEKLIVPKRITPVWLESDGTVRKVEAGWVKTAFELYVSGVGKATIAKRMRESGVERLKKISGPTVEGWLRNKAVLGKWETLVGTPDHDELDIYEPIIEPALFYKAQVQREKVKTKRPVNTTKHFLVGLVKCGSCRKNYIIQFKDGAVHSLRCITRQNLRGCDNSYAVPKPVMDAICRYTSVRATDEAIAQQQMSVNEKEIVVQDARVLELNRKLANLVETIKELGPEPVFVAAAKQAKADRDAADTALTLLKTTTTTPVNEWVQYWQDKGRVSDLGRDDPMLLAAMLRTVNYTITVNLDKRITSSHSDVVYRYLGVDRKTDKYKLMADDQLILVPKDRAFMRDGHEPPEPDHPDEPAESWMEDADYEHERTMHE